MQKSGVKTLSIIDTLSELAHDESEASRLALPSPISVQRGSGNRLSSSRLSISGSNHVGPPLPTGITRGLQPPPVPHSNGHSPHQHANVQQPHSNGQPPQLQPRNPKVSVPMLSPNLVKSPEGELTAFGGAKPRFIASSPNKVGTPEASPQYRGLNLTQNGLQNSLGLSPLRNGMCGSISRQPVVTTPKRRTKMVRPLNQPLQSADSRGQTPDWIRDIFTHAKRGNSEKLASSLEGLEPTLIRNLSDHMGNNLLHTICYNGHAHILPWLTGRFGSDLADGLNDENRNEITPPMAAIKRGRLECLEWLVRNTNTVQEKMSSSSWREGQVVSGTRERCLLHEAAKYGKADLVEWLCEELERQHLDVDQLDSAGNSPLHLAMKKGNIPTVSALLHHGAKIHLKNKMGLTPGDCARLTGRRDCSEYLTLYETSLVMSRELRDVQTKNEQLQSEQAELRGHFKELLTVGKRLSKERDEMSRELGKLQESVMELHDKLIMEIQVLSQENNSLRKNGFKQDEDQNSSSTIDECTSLHERWRQYHRQWFYASLADSEQKLVLADEIFRRSRNQNQNQNSQNNDETYPQRKLRDRLEEMRSRVSAPLINNGGSILFSSSDEEEDEDPPSNDYDDIVDTDFVDAKIRQNSTSGSGRSSLQNSISGRRTTPDISRRKKMPTPTPSLEDSVYSSLSNEMYSKIGSPSSNPTSPAKNLTATSVAMSPHDKRRENRDALRSRLRECALVSESGSASVIEVIEPTSSEEEEFERSLRQLNLGWNIESKNSASRNSRHSDLFHTPELGSSGRNSQSGKDFEQLEEHFVDESSFDDSTSAENRQQRRTKKKSNFLQKIGLKATKWHVKKSPTPTRRQNNDNNVEQDNNSLGCAPLVYTNLPNDEIEEHVLPDSFDDENFFSSTNINTEHNVEEDSNMKVDISAIRRKFENKNENTNEHQNNNNNNGDLSTRCNASLSPSSRKSMLHSGSSYRSSTTSAVSANSASANSVAASEDSGIVVTQPRPTSSASGKPSNEDGDNSSPPTSFYDNNNSNNNNNNHSQMEFVETKLKGLTTSDYVIRPHLGKIEEAASPVASSRCSSSNGLGSRAEIGPRVEIKSSESVRSKSRPGAAIRRRDSGLKAWYDVPSDEDHEAPEADSLASIISHRSSSEEDF